jgi:outer membrane immunogenic protein
LQAKVAVLHFYTRRVPLRQVSESLLKRWGFALKLYLATLVSILALTVGANAADAVVDEVPVPVEAKGFSWTGFYAGVHGGYGWADSDIRDRVQLPGSSLTSETDLDGFLIGAHAGAQYQFDNNIVLGVEMDVDYRDGDGDGAIVGTGEFGLPPGVSQSVEYNWTGSARLRAGYAMDRWLPYVTGGFAFADYDTETLFNGEPIGFSSSHSSVGWTAGVGAEYACTDNMIFRAEYRYSDFGDAEADLFGLPAEVELTSHDVILGVSYKF